MALPAAVGVRVLMDRYRAKDLTGYRVSMRTKRLKALRDARESRIVVQDVAPLLEQPTE